MEIPAQPDRPQKVDRVKRMSTRSTILALFLAVATAMVVVVVVDRTTSVLGPRTSGVSGTTGPDANLPPTFTPFIVAGIKNPVVHPAEAVKVADDAEVIGVVEGDLARAYLLNALTPIYGHVVNDRIGQAPIAVTYCDRDDCIRVFTPLPDSDMPDVHVGGYTDHMLLRVGNDFFEQSTGRSILPGSNQRLPLVARQFIRTTWQKWRMMYPGTSVYIGEQIPNPDPNPQ